MRRFGKGQRGHRVALPGKDEAGFIFVVVTRLRGPLDDGKASKSPAGARSAGLVQCCSSSGTVWLKREEDTKTGRSLV
eukprot:s3057_g4.t1